MLTDGDDTPEELEEKRRKAIAAANSEDGDDSNGGADGDHEGKLLTGEDQSSANLHFLCFEIPNPNKAAWHNLIRSVPKRLHFTLSCSCFPN